MIEVKPLIENKPHVLLTYGCNIFISRFTDSVVKISTTEVRLWFHFLLLF